MPPTRVRYRVLAMVCALSMITYLDRAAFGAAGDSFARELGLSTGTAGLKWAFTAFAISYGLFEVPAGWMGDRFGPRGTLLRIVLWWSFWTAVTGLVGMVWGGVALGGLGALIAVRFLFGAGEAGAYPNITRAIHQWFPRSQWETAQGVVWMSGRLAGGLTPLIWAVLVSGTSYTAPLVPWRGAFLIFGAIGLVWCLIFAFAFRNRPDEHPGVNDEERALIGSADGPSQLAAVIPWGELLKNRNVWLLCLMYSLINYGWIFNITYLPSYLKLRFQVPDGDLWGALSKGAPLWFGAVGCLLGGVLVSRLAQRFRGDRMRARRWVGSSAMLLCAAAWSLTPYADSAARFCILATTAAFGVDLTLGAAWATCQDIGRRNAAVVAAMMNTIGTAGSAIAGISTGWLVERAVHAQEIALHVTPNDLPKAISDQASLAGYDQVFSGYTLVYLVAAVCWVFIAPKTESLEPIALDGKAGLP